MARELWKAPAAHFPDPNFVDRVHREAMALEKVFEDLADLEGVYGRSAGAPSKNRKQHLAVRDAHNLLRDFGRSPTLTQDGPWHRLSNLLFEAYGGETDADLWQTLRDFHSARA